MIEFNTIEQTSILRLKSVLSKDQCQKICKEILNYKESDQKKLDSNMLLNVNTGCWMGMPHKNNGFTSEIESLLADTILKSCYTYADMLKKPSNITTLNTDYLDKTTFHVHAWCNVNSPGSENYLHSHPGNLMSGVLWLQAKHTGFLEFVSNNYLNKLTHPAWPYHGISTYEPEDGDILIFPSYILHRVEKNQSNRDRITMAFDIGLAEK